MHSSRTPDDLEPNALSRLLAAKRAAGRPLLDLVDSNPTRAELGYQWSEIDAALALAGAGIYEPEPRGRAEAREAVAGYFAERRVEVPAERICLTASTSEAYAFLFKLLCDPGDEILFPVPSYPLLEHIARVEGVAPRGYPLNARAGYAIDVDRIDALIGPRTRAVVLVSPNNPTGSIAERGILEELAELAQRRGVALLGDEVFADYPSGEDAGPAPSVLSVPGGLRFALGGLSKAAGLPQLKLSWIAAGGPEAELESALERLDVISDTFLSVGGPVQRALPRLLELGRGIRAGIRERVAGNRRVVADMISRVPGAGLVPSAGGWYAVIELPGGVDEEALCLKLLEEDDVLVHPGYFFDFQGEPGRLVLCLLAPPARTARAVMAIRRRLLA